MARDPRRSTRRYLPEVRQLAVRLVLQRYETNRNRRGVITRVARKLDVRPETLLPAMQRARELEGSHIRRNSVDRFQLLLERPKTAIRGDSPQEKTREIAQVADAQGFDFPMQLPGHGPSPSDPPVMDRMVSWLGKHVQAEHRLDQGRA